jgi:hypothetical protein
VVESDISRKEGYMWRAQVMASSDISDGFMHVETPKVHVNTVSPTNMISWQDFRQL